MRLEGKVAVITGGAGNIGLAAARRFVAEGAKVFIADIDEAGLAAALKTLPADGAAGQRADVTAAASVVAYAKAAAERFGPIDIFFNNAGIEGPTAPIAEFPEDAFDRVMAVNVKGVFLGMKHVPPLMRDGGSVIITSSIAGLMASHGFVAYAASKHAVIGIMRDCAKELAPRRIRVNTVNPGFVESDMLLRIMRGRQPDRDADALYRQIAARTQFGRCVTPDEIAEMVTFLASDESRMATGQTFAVDGGTLLG